MHHASSRVEQMTQSAVELDIFTYPTLTKGTDARVTLTCFARGEEMMSLGRSAPDEIMHNSLLDGLRVSPIGVEHDECHDLLVQTTI